MLDLEEFFDIVITTRTGWFCLGIRSVEGIKWREEFFGWPDDKESILKRIAELSETDCELFFSPHLFSDRSSVKENVLPTRTIIADLDEANVLTLSINPTVLVQTSDERHQGFWILKSFIDLEELEAYSQRLSYSIEWCDRTGWFNGKKIRVPNTRNFKYPHAPLVKVVGYNQRLYDPVELDMLPPVLELLKGERVTEEGYEWVDEALKMSIGPHELMAGVRSDLPNRVVAQFDNIARDRSAALWGLMTAGFRAGLTRNEVFHLARHSANNKFANLRFGGVRELAKDVLRAEASVITKTPDAKARIREARRLPGLGVEKRAYIADLVFKHMAQVGDFIHCTDGSMWYIRKDLGRPIYLTSRSEVLSSMLDSMFGLNGTELESAYSISNMIARVSDMSPVGVLGALTHYDPDAQAFYFHTGRRDVLRITPDKIDTVINGFASIVFPWTPNNELVLPNYKALDDPWDQFIFAGCLDNVIGLKPDQARSLLRVWFITVLLRNAIVARPILALFGQPGAGKSTLFRRLYTLMYGRNKSLNAVTSAEDFDHAVSSDPLVVLDNVDTPERWLPDRLALSAARSEVTKRKLYTNTDTIVLQRQAMLGITAHSPKMLREDVVDRLLVLQFERLQHFLSETEIIGRVIELRNALWGSILSDIQKVLQTPMPTSGWPQFRVEDFAKFGYWISSALGVQEDFSGAINQIRNSQKTLVLEEDGSIVQSLQLWMRRGSYDPEKWMTPGQLWMQLEPLGDSRSFVARYKNAVGLGRKLWSLQDSLRQVFDISWRDENGGKTWLIKERKE